MHTLLIPAILDAVLQHRPPGGASLYGGSAFPLLDGFNAIFGEGTTADCSASLF